MRSLVAGSESKVKKELRTAGVGVHQVEEPTPLVHAKLGLTGTASNSSLLSKSSSSICLSRSPTRLPAAQEEDSLSVLLRERAAARREKEIKKRRALASSSSNNKNNLCEDTDSEETFARHHTRSQPPETLDEAWLEFEELAKSVRTTTERLAQWTQISKAGEAEPLNLSLQQLQSLEGEWRARLHSTQELAGRTRAAHQLAARMLSQVRSGRVPSKADTSSSSPQDV